MAGVQLNQTAIVVPVPEVEPVVGASRQRHDASARTGMPAHITLLYPFLPTSALDDQVLTELRDLCAAARLGAIEFRRTVRLGGRALGLAPEPADGLMRLTLAIAERWPETPPYGGEFDEVIPHLTVAVSDDTAVLDAVEAELVLRLPITATVRQAWLYTFDRERWARYAALPLGS